jgi:hypothetical protein
MVIVTINEEIKQKLKQNNFSTLFLNNCHNSKFLSIHEINSKIVGVGCVGGLMNHYAIELKDEYYGRGLWRNIFNEIHTESQNRNMSFLTGVYKTTNLISIKIQTSLGFTPIFSIDYNKVEGREVVIILPFNSKGKLIKKIMKIFDTKIGNMLFSLFFILSKPILKNIIGLSSKTMSKIDLKYSLYNFEKVKAVMEKINLN